MVTPLLLLLANVASAGPDACTPWEVRVEALHESGSCFTMNLLALQADARAAGAEHCVAPALSAHGLPPVPPPAPVWPVRPLDDGDEPEGLALRDAFSDDHPNVWESDHFVLKFGDGPNAPDGRTARELLGFLEEAWQREVVELGYPAPLGTDLYKFNAYIGNTSRDVPDIDSSAAGYFTADPEGFPMLVLNPSTLRELERAKLTLAHELYHAIQWTIATYPMDRTDVRWYWEATASWIESEVYPDNFAYADKLYGFAFLPDKALWTFQFIGQGSGLESTHPYGAFIWPHYLAEFHGGPDLVRETFLDTRGVTDPLRVAGTLLEERDATLENAFFDFSARNATWDYEDGDTYRFYLSRGAAQYYRNSSRRPSDVLTSDDLDVELGPGPWPPESYGANYWRLENLPEQFEVTFTGDPAPTWYVAVQHKLGSEQRRWDAVAEGDETVRVTVDQRLQGSDAWLVVAPANGTVLDNRTYDYTFTLTDVTPAPEPVDTDDGVGTPAACASVPARSVGLGALLVGLLAVMRRRPLIGARPRA